MNKTIRRALRWIGGNLLVLLVLLVGFNLLSRIALDLGQSVRQIAQRLDPDYASGSFRWRMPNYEDKGAARQIFADVEALDVRYRPFIGWLGRPAAGSTLTIGEEGDRLHRPPQPASDAAPLVRFFGGSTMWGFGSPDSATIPAIFNELSPDVRVRNHAQPGFTARQSLDRLMTLISMGEPVGTVVFYDGVNDVFLQCRRGAELPTHMYEPRFRDRIESGPLYTLLLGSTAELLATIYRVLSPPTEQFACADDPALADRVAEMLLTSWQIAAELVSARGGRFVAILQPVSFAGEPRRDHIGRELAAWPELEGEYAAVYGIVRERIATLPYGWDLSGAFDGDELIYIDFNHVSPNGNRIIASRLLEIVTPDGEELRRSGGAGDHGGGEEVEGSGSGIP